MKMAVYAFEVPLSVGTGFVKSIALQQGLEIEYLQSDNLHHKFNLLNVIVTDLDSFFRSIGRAECLAKQSQTKKVLDKVVM